MKCSEWETEKFSCDYTNEKWGAAKNEVFKSHALASQSIILTLIYLLIFLWNITQVDPNYCRYLKYRSNNVAREAEAVGHNTYLMCCCLAFASSQSRSAMYFPWDWLAVPPREKIRKTVVVCFCGRAETLSSVFNTYLVFETFSGTKRFGGVSNVLANCI